MKTTIQIFLSISLLFWGVATNAADMYTLKLDGTVGDKQIIIRNIQLGISDVEEPTT